MKKEKKRDKKDLKKSKIKYILKLVFITILVTIILEFCYVIFKSVRESSTAEFKEFNQRIVNVDEGYLVVGSSNFKYSKFNKKSGKYEKPRIAIYNNENVLETEIKYNKGYNGLFTDVVKKDNSYIAVGITQKTKTEYKNNLTEALIVKYDQNNNIVWEKNYKKYINTRFNKIISIKDGYIVVGNSTNENSGEKEKKAGALISKYDEDGKILWEEYYNDSKTATFNDVIEVNDGYIVVGSKNANTGIIAKYDKNGLFKWKKEAENIGSNGFVRVIKHNDKLIIIGSFNQSEYVQNRTNTALLMLTDLKGNVEKYVEYGEKQNIAQWNDIVVDNNSIYVVGVSSYINEELSNDKITYYNNKAIYVKYDMNLKLLEKKEVDKQKTYQYTSLILKNKNLYVTGYTNAKIDIEHADGKNYVSFIEQLQMD